MKKLVLVITSLLLMSNVAFASDYASNLMLNPAYSWFPGNINHSSYEDRTNSREYKTERPSKPYISIHMRRKYNTCIKFDGGNACKRILKITDGV